MRPSDEVGWFSSHEIGVILPDTPPKGAEKFGRDICQKIFGANASIHFDIYTYPKNNNRKSPIGPGNHSTQHKNSPLTVVYNTDYKNISDRELKVNGLEPILGKGIPLWKRGIDIFGAVFGLILCLPVFLGVAALIKCISPGPVFFRQKRVGYLGKTFTMLKFRTMHVDADTALHVNHVEKLINNDQPLKKLDKTDPRIIPGGRILRLTGLDELPQLINVLLGEMSLVGPRPELPSSVEHCRQWHSQRFDTTPGLSGLWQVSDRTEQTFNEMMRLDISYVKRRSLWLDTQILIKTFPTILIQMTDRS